MRYSTLASTVLFAVATAPALAHPITNRATEDASMVERELQDALMERSYYYDLLSRDLEARKTADEAVPKPDAASVQREERERHMVHNVQLHLQAYVDRQRQGQSGPHSESRPSPSHPQRNGGGAGAHHPREYDLDGELFGRATEDASMVERELQDALMERGYYDDLLSRDLEARKTADDTVSKPGAASIQRRPQTGMDQVRQRMMNLRLWQGTRPQGPTHNSGSRPGPSHPQQSGGGGQRTGGQHHPREYVLDGGLFERGFEVDELD
ncbi:uncharacterized protein B0H18DRAFT_1216068 [Fomitopsis serialis]|uniref:uncharacterized protein n=1 Tax=Fomitopsis serialis TaxID=139415 RepID=UPI00200770B4|nr:uncharacterized protein B0H18DRAFT_1216068 [Neoantrodia serialis]KAH9914352.1 hypothetical protein B0H18DRAFT_1216068 [Neoantrodia serialis]